MSEKTQWLLQEPTIEEIRNNSDGSQFIPIAIVESLLTELTNGDWSTSHFNYSVHVYGTTLLITASVELDVTYEAVVLHGDYIYRKMVGATTFTDSKHGSNLDFAATALSECIKNAAKKLGPRFGKNLNGRAGDLAASTADTTVKPTMDIITQKKYEKAISSGDTKTQLEIENYYQI